MPDLRPTGQNQQQVIGLLSFGHQGIISRGAIAVQVTTQHFNLIAREVVEQGDVINQRPYLVQIVISGSQVFYIAIHFSK